MTDVIKDKQPKDRRSEVNRKALSTNTVLLTIYALLVVTMSADRAVGQTGTPTPTPESEEIRRLREEKTRAELEKDIAVAEKAEFDAKFPKPATTPLAGETKVNEGAVIESEMVSYLSMAYAANRIVDRLRDPGGCKQLVTNAGDRSQEAIKACDGTAPAPTPIPINSLAIYNKADVDLLLNYKAVNNQLELLRVQGFCDILPQGTPGCERDDQGKVRTKSLLAGIPTISSFLGAFVDMTALLRTNVTIQGHTFDIAEGPLVSEIFRAIRAPDGYGAGVTLYYPAVFPPNLDAEGKSELLERLEQLNDLKVMAGMLSRSLEAQLKQVVELKEKITTLSGFIKNADAQVKAHQDELDRLEKLRKEVLAKGWRVPFDVLERIERLRERIINIPEEKLTAQRKLSAAQEELKKLGGDPVPEQDKLEGQIRERLAKMKAVVERFDQVVSTLTKTDTATGINALTAYIRAEQLRSAVGGRDSYWLQLGVVKAGGNNRIKTNLIVDIFTGGSRLSHSGGVIVQYNLYKPNGESILSDTLTEYTGYTKAGRIKRLTNPIDVKQVPPRTPAHP